MTDTCVYVLIPRPTRRTPRALSRYPGVIWGAILGPRASLLRAHLSLTHARARACAHTCALRTNCQRTATAFNWTKNWRHRKASHECSSLSVMLALLLAATPALRLAPTARAAALKAAPRSASPTMLMEQMSPCEHRLGPTHKPAVVSPACSFPPSAFERPGPPSDVSVLGNRHDRGASASQTATYRCGTAKDS